MKTLQITEPLIRKLLHTIDHGLTRGLGNPVPGKMCVEAAICYALGEPHGDGPICVESCVRNGKIALNDASWSSDKARAIGMRAVAIAQLGSKGVVAPAKYVKRLAELTIRQIVPIGLRAAAKLNPGHADSLLAAAQRCEGAGTSDAARAAANAATAATAAAADAATGAAYAATNAARAAAYAAYAYATAAAADAAADAAAYAAYATAAAADAADAAARDEVFSLSAALMTQALTECGSPGCEWLWMLEEA